MCCLATTRNALKRWLGLLVLGVCHHGPRHRYLLREAYLTYTSQRRLLLTLQFIPRYLRGSCLSSSRLVPPHGALESQQSAARALSRESHGDTIADESTTTTRGSASAYRRKSAAGRLIYAAARLKEHTSNLTGIVTVADDGGARPAAARDGRLATRRPPQLHRCVAEADPSCAAVPVPLQ